MVVKIKRVYYDAEAADGYRILVDRLWPRGISKESAGIDLWAKELAPSKELFTWFHEDKTKRFTEFQARYQSELNDNKTLIKDLISSHNPLTLVTSVKDIDHSHIPTLKTFISRLER